MSNVFDFTCKGIGGEAVPLAGYRGQVLVIVNVASACGFTPQYAELEALYRRYRDQGFSVLGFPCNQFGGQEPGSEEEIQVFCSTRFQVSFPMFSKIAVNGENADPLFRHLCEVAPGLLGSRAVKWNFTKFLVDRNGTAVERFAPATSPEQMAARIEALLAAR